MRRLLLRSPKDELVKSIEQELKQRTEGFLHVLRNDGQYSVIFAPITGGGGAVPAKHIRGEGKLREFLENQLRILPRSVEDALAELAAKGSTSIYPFRASPSQLRKMGLA